MQKLYDDVWLVKGSLPKRAMPRNMVVYRLPDATLLIHSAIWLDEAGLSALEALGKPSLLLVPNGFHRMDARRYKARYPDVRVICPEAARKAVEKVIAVDATCEDTLPARGVKYHAPSGLKPAELVYELPAGPGQHALVMTDLMMNLPGLPGLEGLMLQLFGPGRVFGVTRIAKLMLVKDKAKFRAWLEAQAARPGLTGVIVAHGEPVTKDAAAAVKEAALRL